MDKTFFKKIEDLIDIIPINAQNNLLEIQKQFISVQRKDLYPIFGGGFINEILEIYHDVNFEDEASDYVKSLIGLFQIITGNIGVANWTYFKNIDMSTFMTEREDESFKSAKQWRVDDLRDFLYNTGFNAIDQALELIESSDDETFNAFKESDYYAELKMSIISNINDFEKWHFINNSRRVFLLLRPNIRYIENFQLKELFSPIWEKLSDTEYQKILEFLQALLVKKSIIKSIDLNVLNFTSIGIRTRIRQGDSQNKISEADKHFSEKMRTEAEEEANFLYESLIKELNSKASLTIYKEWFESTYYKPTTTENYDQDYTDKIYMG